MAAYCGCLELLAWMREHLTARPASTGASARTAKPDAPEIPDAPRNQAVPDLLKAAEARFPEAVKGGKMPSLRMIQGEMGVGQDKAQQVQGHFLSLQAATG